MGKSGITDSIKMGSFKPPSIDPFDELDPLGKDQDKLDLIWSVINKWR